MWKTLIAAVMICAALPARAGNLDSEADGATVHRRAFVFPQCIRLSRDPLGWDWMLDPPCRPSDLATVGPGTHIHYRRNLTPRELEQALIVSIKAEHSGQ